MTYTKPHWRDTSTISEREIEHRLTRLEHTAEAQEEEHDAHHKVASEHRDRLNLHERAIVAIVTAIYVLMQDKFPKVAQLLRELIR